MSQSNLKIGPKIKAFRRQLGIQANKLAEKAFSIDEVPIVAIIICFDRII